MKSTFYKIIFSLFLASAVIPQTHGISFTIPTPQLQIPNLSLGLSVVATYPANNERVVSSVRAEHHDPLPVVMVLFSEPISSTATAKNAVTITFLSDDIMMSRDFFSAEIVGNALYIESTHWFSDDEYIITIDGSQIKSKKTGDTLGNNYSWRFKTAKTRYTNPPNNDENEPSPQILVTKTALSPAVEILNNTDAITTYRLSFVAYDITDLSTITIKDVLPSGFSFDSIVGGNVSNGSTVNAQGTNTITFTITGEVNGGDTFYFDYRAKVSGQMSNNIATVPAGTYHNIAYVKGYFTPSIGALGKYGNNNFRSSFNDSRQNTDDVVVTRRTTVLPTPQVNAPTPHLNVPSPSITPIATPLSPITPAATDPLVCLRTNGLPTITFSDTPGSVNESVYIDFLNTTTFVSFPETRLVKGYNDNTFGPDNTLTRFELTKIALGANCINYLENSTPNTIFSDVPKDSSEMSLVIGKAYEKGIVKGIGDKFHPNRAVTYGEMVKILIGSGIYFDHGEAVAALPNTLNGITDESFRQFAEHSVYLNLINLNANNTFPQNESVKRRFMAQAAARYIAKIKKIDLF